VQVLYLDNHTKSAKLLHKKLLDQKRCTSFQDVGPIRYMWPMVEIPLFLTSCRDEILTLRDGDLSASFKSRQSQKKYQATGQKLLDQKRCTSF